MQPTRIEWTRGPNGERGYSWNPIRGICPQGCWYCFGRRLYQRFKLDPEIRLDLDELQVPFPKKPSRIFACSTFELFHPSADPYRDNVFRHIKLSPEHTFIILTKMPERIDRPMPENVWLGTTVTGFDDYLRKIFLFKMKARVRFVSYEPILIPLPPVFPVGLDWLIMGRLTGHGNGRNPELDTIKNIIEGCKDLHIPLFMKDNLRSIWPGPLIQEMPR